MCFQFGAWRKGSKTSSTVSATTPQTLLTSTAPGGAKAVRFDSGTPDSVPSLTRPSARKGTPWQGEGEEAAAQAVQFAEAVGEKDDEVDPVRKEVRKVTPWHGGLYANAATASHIRFASNSCTDEDARKDDEVDPVRKEVRKATPWNSSSNANAAATSNVRFASGSCTDEDARTDDEVDPVRKEVRKSTPWHGSSSANAATASNIRFASDEDAMTSGAGEESTEEVRTPKVAQCIDTLAMQTVADEENKSRHIRWSVSAEQAYLTRHSDEVGKTDSTRQPGRKATPFISSAEAAKSNEEKDRHIQWSESVEEPSARRRDRQGTPWHSGVETPTCCEQVDRHIEWSDSVEEPSDRRPDRKGTPWANGAQNANREEETDAHIHWSESVEDFSDRRADRKCTPWHAGDAQPMDIEETERADLEQEAPMHAVAEEVVLEASVKSVEIHNKAVPKGLSLLTACCLCRSSPNVSTDELEIIPCAV